MLEIKTKLLTDEGFVEKLLGAMPNMFFATDLNGRIIATNFQSSKRLGFLMEELEGRKLEDLTLDGDVHAIRVFLASAASGIGVAPIELSLLSGAGASLYCRLSSVGLGPGTKPSALLVFAEDISALKLAKDQLVQSQKLEAVGRLTAGVAHEINTPVQYIGSNTEFLKSSWRGLTALHCSWEKLTVASGDRPDLQELVREINQHKEEVDLEYLQEEFSKCLDQTLEGVGNVSKIVRSLKAFSHPGSPEKEAYSLSSIIENSVTVTRNEWKYVAELDMDIDESVHSVFCFRSELSQVIANLIINAAHAIGEQRLAEGRDELGQIHVSLGARDGFAEVTIADNGPGIPKEIQERVFERFFTTKAVGKGTGQGLSIARSIIVERHQGEIRLDSRKGHTTFIIRLPLEPVASL